MVGGADGSDGSLEAWFLANFDVFTPVATMAMDRVSVRDSFLLSPGA